MGRIDNISVNILYIIYIDANRQTWYNKAILEEGVVFCDAPRGEKSKCQRQKHSKRRLQSM